MPTNRILKIRPLRDLKVYNPITGNYLDDKFNIVANNTYWQKILARKEIEIIKEERVSLLKKDKKNSFNFKENIGDKEDGNNI